MPVHHIEVYEIDETYSVKVAIGDLFGFIHSVGVIDRSYVLFVTADHGCDPSTPSTDHSREYVPLIAYGKNIRPINLGTMPTYACIAKTVCDMLGVKNSLAGESFYAKIRK